MSEAVRDFKDLVVWQRAIRFATEVYRLTRHWPPEEKFGLISQVRRAAVSVSSNIAEGHSRHRREFVHFLSIARGSLSEAESQLFLAVELGYLKPADITPAREMAQETRRMVAVITRKLTPDP